MTYPQLIINGQKIEHNTRLVAGLLKSRGCAWCVAKGTAAHLDVVGL